MAKITKHPADENPLAFLKEFTEARIAVGTTGTSIPAKALLDFNLAHAHARDAVYSTVDVDQLSADLAEVHLQMVSLCSSVTDRVQYLQRPDLGRKLNSESVKILTEQITGADVTIVIIDGLSSFAINDNAINLLKLLVPRLQDSE
ncbi:MAG: ethanolamine ammonia-lyase, partial [Pedobacter sp.]